MSIEHLKYRLPETPLKLLTRLVEVAEQDGTLSVHYSYQSAALNMHRYVLKPSNGNVITIDASVDILKSLKLAQYVEILDDNEVFLLPIAFDRIRYERKWKILQWWELFYQSGRTLACISFLAFVLGLLAAAASAIVELLKYFNYM